MKYLLIIILCITSNIYAQQMSVISFEMDEKDLTANLQGTIVYDQNANKCALIKVITTETGFSFDTGALGVAKTVQHTGELWLYVPSGVKRLSISHPKYEKINKYDLGMTLESARTYLLKLSVERKADDVTGLGGIRITTEPVGVETFIDGISIGVTPLSFSKLLPGSHKVLLKSEGFFDLEEDVTIVEGDVVNIDKEMVKSCDIDRNSDRINITIKNVEFSMIKVNGGDFYMGGTNEQRKSRVDEKPIHKVTLSDYYMGETEVTNELWAAVMGSNPSYFTGPKQPVNNITWSECKRFLNRLSSLTGLMFVLPTEAQWEFAARGGNMSKSFMYSGGNNPKEVAWFPKNSGKQIKDVKMLMPNELGLYDMSGNVWECCSDYYAPYSEQHVVDPKGPEKGIERICRGGAVADDDNALRVSFRLPISETKRLNTLGLRMVMIE